jgi:hypothetical protein
MKNLYLIVLILLCFSCKKEDSNTKLTVTVIGDKSSSVSVRYNGSQKHIFELKQDTAVTVDIVVNSSEQTVISAKRDEIKGYIKLTVIDGSKTIIDSTVGTGVLASVNFY